MKKLTLILVLAIFGLTLNSCKNEIKTKTLDNLSQNIDDYLETVKDTVKYIDIQTENEWLWKISEKYLGDGMRHMEIAGENPNIFKDPKRWHTDGKNESWDYAYVEKGDRIYLPNDAFGVDVKSIYTEHTRVKEGKNIKDAFIGSVEVIDTEGVEKKESNSSSINSFMPLWWLLPLLILLVLAYIIYLLLNRRNGDDCCDRGIENQNNNHRQTNERLDEIIKNQNDQNCCKETQNKLQGLKHQISNLQKEINENSDTTTNQLKQLPNIIKAAGEAAGEDGNYLVDLEVGDVKLYSEGSKSADLAPDDEEVEKIVTKTLEKYFDFSEEDEDIIVINNYIFGGENEEEILKRLEKVEEKLKKKK